MRHFALWVGVAAVLGCGHTENLIGTLPEATGAGGTPPTGADCKVGDGNWVRCEDGLQHRTAPGLCPSTLPRASSLAPKGSEDECLKDSDCTAKAHGHCQLLTPLFGEVAERNVCRYGCTSDADCGEGTVCLCAEPVGQCVEARSCKSDEDCPGGSLCARYDSCPGVSIAFDYACQLPADECRTNADCSGGLRYCSIGPSGHRECVGEQCAI